MNHGQEVLLATPQDGPGQPNGGARMQAKASRTILAPPTQFKSK